MCVCVRPRARARDGAHGRRWVGLCGLRPNTLQVAKQKIEARESSVKHRIKHLKEELLKYMYPPRPSSLHAVRGACEQQG